MRNRYGIALTLLACVVSLLEGEKAIAILFLCGTTMFAVESISWRLKRAASIVDRAQDVIRAPGTSPENRASRGSPHHDVSNSIGTSVETHPH